MIKRVVLGPVANERVAALKDVSRREFWMLGSLAGFVLFVGLWPDVIGRVMHPSVENLAAHVAQSKLGGAGSSSARSTPAPRRRPGSMLGPRSALDARP